MMRTKPLTPLSTSRLSAVATTSGDAAQRPDQWPKIKNAPASRTTRLDVSESSRLRVESIGEQAGVHLDLPGTVPSAWPEEPPQAIPFGARHHVQVEMGDRLAHHIVHRHKGALNLQSLHNCAGDPLGQSE